MPDWQTDKNHNGIQDGYEWIKDGQIELTSDHKRLAYNTSTPLEATLKKDGKILAFDSLNEVVFNVKRIVSYDADGKSTVVYARSGSGDVAALDTLKNYITFTPVSVRADSGVASYQIQSKDRDVDVILDATVAPKDQNGAVAFTKISNELTIEVRGESLNATPSFDLHGTKSITTTFAAGTTDTLNFDFETKNAAGKTIASNPPFTLNIFDDADGTKLE